MELSQSGLLEIELQGVEGKKIAIIDEDHQIEIIVKALSSKTRREILRYIRGGPKDVSNIAKTLNMTEANISAQIKKLEQADLISCDYSSGLHGVRKISKLKTSRITLSF
jgi:predicted transcriptional regulator